LKVDIQDVSSYRKTLKIEIPVEDVKKEIDEAYDKVNSSVVIPGFRKGKTPKSVLKMRFNEYIKVEAIEKLVPNAIKKATNDAKLKILRPLKTEDINPPVEEIKISEEEPLIFEATFDIRPEIILPDLTKLEVDKSDIDVSKENVDNYLEGMRQERATYIPLEDEAADKGNYVKLSITATSEGNTIKEEKEAVIEVSEDMPVPEILNYIIGMKTGEEKDFSVSFPTEYKSKENTPWQDVPLAGKEVNFHVILLEISQKVLPALDDDFAKDLGEEDLQHLIAKVWNQIVDISRIINSAQQIGDLMNQLMQKSQVDVPEFLIKEQADEFIKQDKLEAKKNQAEFEEITEEKMKEYEKQALELIKEAWVLDKLSETEGIAVTEEEVDGKIREMALAKNMEFQKYKKIQEDTNRIDSIRSSIWRNKIFNILISKAAQKQKLIV